MAKHKRTIHCVDFNSTAEVKSFLSFLTTNKAKVVSYTSRSGGFNVVAISTVYRIKKEEEK